MIVLNNVIAFLVQKLLYYQITVKVTLKFNGCYFVGASDMAIKLLTL